MVGRVVVVVIFFFIFIIFIFICSRRTALEGSPPRIGSPPKSAPSNVSVASRSYRVSTAGIRQKAIISSNEGM